jgi:hypothetical protein
MNAPALSQADPLRGRWFALIAIFAAYRLLPYLPDSVNPFAATHFLLSYAVGFHKRALLGTTLSWLLPRPTARDIYAISLVILVSFALCLMLFMKRVALMSRVNLVVVLVLLGAPGLLPHSAYALGYLDPILVICGLSAAAILWAPITVPLRIPIALALCAVGTLTHEAFLFVAFPLVAMRTLVRQGDGRGPVYVLGVATLALTVIQFLVHPLVSPEQYLAHAAARTEMRLDPDVIQLLYFSMPDNLLYLARHYASVMTDLRLLAGLIVPIPYFLLLSDLFRIAATALQLSGALRLWALACILAPLTLTLVGFDTLRWISFACLNCSIFVHECMREDGFGTLQQSLDRYVSSARFALLALFSFSVGVLHVVDGNALATGIHELARGLEFVRW